MMTILLGLESGTMWLWFLSIAMGTLGYILDKGREQAEKAVANGTPKFDYVGYLISGETIYTFFFNVILGIILCVTILAFDITSSNPWVIPAGLATAAYGGASLMRKRLTIRNYKAQTKENESYKDADHEAEKEQ